jgi:hypothetical protein
VAGCCECGDEPSGSCATELVSWLVMLEVFVNNVLRRIFWAKNLSEFML